MRPLKTGRGFGWDTIPWGTDIGRCCNECGHLKPWDEYHKNESGFNGHVGRCGECNSNSQKKYRKRGYTSAAMAARRKITRSIPAGMFKGNNGWGLLRKHDLVETAAAGFLPPGSTWEHDEGTFVVRGNEELDPMTPEDSELWKPQTLERTE